MGWDGAGNFTRARNWQNDEAADIDMLSANFDEEDDNFATGINACLTKNGETKPTADFRPNATRTYALGSTSLRWTNAYLSGSINVQSATAAAATTIAVTDGTSARTVTIPDASGTVMLSGTSNDGDITYTGKQTFSDQAYFALGIGPSYIQNYSLAAAVAASALTITLSGYDGTALSATNKAQFAFRSATAGTGTYSVVESTANLTLTISAGSTMGTTSAVAARFWVVLFNDAGTLRLGAINCSTSTAIYPLADDILASSTAEGGAGAADSAGVIYTGTAVTSKAMRVLGYIENTQATAGTYATTPSKVQPWQPGMKLPGDVVQIARTATGTSATGTTLIPLDNTIPQNTEGDEYMTKAITPSAAPNVLAVSAQWIGTNSHATPNVTVALFQDTTANALAASYVTTSSAGPDIFNIRYVAVSATTSSTTFKIRAGNNNAGTTTFNGAGGAGLMGGVTNSFLEIVEIMG